ncbi:MAG: TIM barrel protein [Eudoraea sp.]
MKKKKNNFSRRRFIGTSVGFAAATAVRGSSLFVGPSILESQNKPNSLIKGVQIGVITYSFRSMPDQSAEATLKYVVDCGINAIELMGDPAETYAGKPENPVNPRDYYALRRSKRAGETLSAAQEKEFAEMEDKMAAHSQEVAQWRSTVPMDKFVELRKMYNDAGVTIYAFKPRAFGMNNTDAEIDWGLRAAKALGASHVTLEHPGDDAHTQKLGRMGEKHGIYIAYHGHEQQTPTFWDTALEQSNYNSLNLDLGHYVAAGNANPLEIISSKHDRIMSMHTKDRQTPEHGKGNVLWGTGDTPITQALQLIRDNNYKFPVTIELEYDIPEGSNAIEEVKKCLQYCEKSLS